jgi:hypothetical protein
MPPRINSALEKTPAILGNLPDRDFIRLSCHCWNVIAFVEFARIGRSWGMFRSSPSIIVERVNIKSSLRSREWTQNLRWELPWSGSSHRFDREWEWFQAQSALGWNLVDYDEKASVVPGKYVNKRREVFIKLLKIARFFKRLGKMARPLRQPKGSRMLILSATQ